jgi:hypothetical protein
VSDPFQARFAIAIPDNVFSVYEDSEDIYLSGYSANGLVILAPQNVSDPSGVITSVSRNPTISIDSLGKIHILFEDDRAGQFDVHYTKLDQLGTVDVAVLSPGATTGIDSLDHEIDESGNIHLAYVEGTSLEYQKLSNVGVTVIVATTMSGTSGAKTEVDIDVNGNTTTTSITGSANGNNLFDDTATGFPGPVQPGQTLVLTGGSLEYDAILDGTITEPGPFAATLLGTTSSAFMDTSIGTGNNTLDAVVNGVTVNITFTDTTLNPIATVISEINAASLATALAANIASNSGNDEVLLTSPTTGLGSTINITTGNVGIGFALGAAAQGGSGYDTSIVNGTNTMDLRVDGVDLNIVFTDTNGNSLVNVLSEINAVSLASALAASIASDGGSIPRITSPDVGVDAYIEVVGGNTSLGFTTLDREEGGNELGSRIGIIGVAPTQITLASVIRTVSIAADITYRIESIEAGVVWIEDGDTLVAKIDDTASVFLSATNLSRVDVQTSQVAVPTVSVMVNGPGVDEISFEDTAALFVTNSARAGHTLRVTAATPGTAIGDYIIKQVDSETEAVLIGTLPSSPANSVTYEVFQTLNDTQPNIGTNTDNGSQILWVENKRKINRIELDRLGAIITAKATLTTRPDDASTMSLFVDSSDAMHVGWIERHNNSGDPYMMRVDEFGDVTLDPVVLTDSLENGSDLTIKTTSENEPCIIWLGLDNSGSQTNSRLLKHKRSAQDYFLKINDPSIRLSVKEDNSIIFTKEFIDQPIRVNYRTAEDIQAVEDFVQDPSNQIIDSNYLVKHTIPVIISTTINYRGNVEDPQQTVINFISSVTESTLEASDIADSLYSAGATFVELPFTMTAVYSDMNGIRVKLSDQDIIMIPRIGRFLAESANITVTDLG